MARNWNLRFLTTEMSGKALKTQMKNLTETRKLR